MAAKAIVRYRSRPRPKTKRRGRAGFTLPLAAIGGLFPLVGGTVQTYKATRDFQATGDFALASLTGYKRSTGEWQWSEMRQGLMPILIGLLVHKVVGGSLGLNRALGRAGVPFVRI